MSQNNHLFNQLCDDLETRETAKEIYHLANAKTRPGSGFDLGALRTGLPAICAYIASIRLKNNQISRVSAQQSSCLKPSDFDKGVAAVESALGAGASRRSRSNTDGFYQNLIEEYELTPIAQLVISWVRRTESVLVMREVFNVDRKEVKCAVFFWVCSFLKAELVLKASQDDVDIEKEMFLSQFSVDTKKFELIFRKLVKTAGSLAQQIKAERKSYDPSKKVTPFSTPHASPRKSPSKTPLRVAPSNSPTKPNIYASSPMKSIVQSPFPPSTPSSRKSPSRSLRVPPTNDKRKAVEEDDSLESPTKKRKLESPQPTEEVLKQSPLKKRKVQTPRGSPTKLLPVVQEDEDENLFQTPSKKRPVASSSRISLSHTPFPQPQFSPPSVAMDVDDLFSEEEPDLAPQRRFRPVFLDAKQWASSDPRLESIAKKADIAKRGIIEAYGHPFERWRNG
ncbi:uncharacterized protein BT62DRAFT_994635 [Guyanagaster necrorhizus]|uniref:Uncharacterized protein n=1 Tax=Guyanagaster necrorhizus TaxID=856835 RepID=A0A9P8ARX3_9AGAR|nr:uncharacterized protein BT62DRAFT_994635 [Guyanagaster necrorhizus MCA 3950]KAG7445669.1 hypothetical protein BT62DRAFT_994635 [Guyanagaster necrorhizus MCA 3950]